MVCRLAVGVSLLVFSFGALPLGAAVQGVSEDWQQLLTPDLLGGLLNVEKRATPEEISVINLLIKQIDEKIIAMIKDGFDANAESLAKLITDIANQTAWAQKNQVLAEGYQTQLNTCHKGANDLWHEMLECSQSESLLKANMDAVCGSAVANVTYNIAAPYNEAIRCNMKGYGSGPQAIVAGNHEVCNAYVHTIKSDAKQFFLAAAESFANAKRWCKTNTTAYNAKVVECQKKAAEKSTQEAKCAVMEAQRDSSLCLFESAVKHKCELLVRFDEEVASVQVEEATRHAQFSNVSVVRCLLTGHLGEQEERCFAEPARAQCTASIASDYDLKVGVMDYHSDARAQNACAERSITLGNATYQKMESGAYSAGGPKIVDISAQGVMTPPACQTL